MVMKAYIALEDGSVFEGKSFGANVESEGEIVFNTSLTGYQEILTDPSYKGQIVVMTNPLIGNYGVNDEDVESLRPMVNGFIVKECSRITSNWRSQKDLSTYLKENNISGVEGVDTREITKKIREKGALNGIIGIGSPNVEILIEKAKRSIGILGKDLVKEVTCSNIWQWNPDNTQRKTHKIIVYDFGVKYSILRQLEKHNCEVWIVPSTTPFDEIKKMNPSGILLSNGPGDPAALSYIVDEIKKVIGYKPILAICLGHQIVCQALGAKTYKLKFGHRGGNHPVMETSKNVVGITSQNHGFCVDLESLPQSDVDITFSNLNDKTVEGIRHKKYPLISVQFHPEASPGPHDTTFLFDEFIQMLN